MKIRAPNLQPADRMVAQCKASVCPDLNVVWTADQKLYLVNRTESEKKIPNGGELFGFNVGQFEELKLGLVFSCSGGLVCPAKECVDVPWIRGLAKTAAKDKIPFILTSDVQTLVAVDRQSANARGQKELCCLSQIAHELCTTHGLTEMNVIDHDVCNLKTEAGLRL